MEGWHLGMCGSGTEVSMLGAGAGIPASVPQPHVLWYHGGWRKGSRFGYGMMACWACVVLVVKSACLVQVLGDLLVYRMSFDTMAGGGKAPDLAMEGWHVGHVW